MITKRQSVLDERIDHLAGVIFAQRFDPLQEDRPDVHLQMSEDLFKEFGYPDTVTITVEVGDQLN